MPDLAAYRARLDEHLASLAAEHGVPGAACGVLVGDESAVATYGVANVATGAPVGPATLFQLGSITKVYTATLVMQAVGARVISLDEPVRSVLQEFSVADPAATIEITPRHLLAHTSGIQGDHLIDTGWNDDALARYVATLAGLGQLHPTGAAYSFCNTGYGVLGRLLEVTTGDHFDRALRRRLTRPLGCRATLTLPQHALLHGVAAGHVQAPGGAPTRQPRWVLTRSNGPMGGIMAPPGEVLALARMHLRGGRGADGHDLLSPAGAEAMQHPHASGAVPGEHAALGWTVRRWGDLTCLGQDADTFGQRALLRVVPERDLAVCAMTNSPAGAPVIHGLVERVAADLLGVEPAHLDPLAGLPADAARVSPGDATPLAGTYARLHQRIAVTVDGDRLHLATEPSGVLRALGVGSADLAMSLAGRSGDGCVVAAGTDPASGLQETAAFVPEAGGRPAGLYLQGRFHRLWH
ncbi:MAG TPA: serine hydrolase domain-containing protein [Acidimicrobiales bacterium]